MTKKNEIKYGIEITKPHSTEMYQHNDEVAHAMKSNMGEALSKNYDAAKKAWYDNDECDVFECRHEKALRDIGMAIEGTGYGDGYNLDDILQGALKSLDNMANWQLHEEYSYLQFKGLVPRTHFMMIGFNTQEWPAGTPINYDYTNANELSSFAPSVQVK